MDKAAEFISLLSDFALAILALWQGFVIVSDGRLRRLAGLGQAAVQGSIWYKLRKVDGPVLIMVIGGFAVAIVLRIARLI